MEKENKYQKDTFYQVRDNAPCRQAEIYKILDVSDQKDQKITFLAIKKNHPYIAEFMIGSALDSWLNKIPFTKELETASERAMEISKLNILPYSLRNQEMQDLCEICDWNFDEIKRLDNICCEYLKTLSSEDPLFKKYLSTINKEWLEATSHNIEGFIHLYMENKEKENKLLEDENEK